MEDEGKERRRQCDNDCVHYRIDTRNGDYCEMGNPSAFVNLRKVCIDYTPKTIAEKVLE